MPQQTIDLVRLLLASCVYPEDVAALVHFVFHPRYNGASRLCLMCMQHDVDGEGHAADCEYRVALARTMPLAGQLDIATQEA